MTPLDAGFYSRDVLEAAPDLVGKILCRKLPGGGEIRLRITETEAYRGEEDGACHARFGRTPRTETMYLPGGYSYVYLVYGLHHLLNVVTGKENEPQAVLIRAMEAPFDGPAKWTRHMHITREHNGLWLPQNDQISIVDDGYRPEILTAPRVGIDYAPEYWRDMPWRFIDQNHCKLTRRKKS